MIRKFAWNLFSALLGALVLSVCSAKAQTIAYRQTNLSSDVPGTANHTDQALRNPWGVAFNPGQPFFIANNNGRVISQDASGAFTAPGGFIFPNPAGNGPGRLVIGIVADPSSFFGGRDLVQPFITVTDNGGISLWGVDARGDIPTAATLVVDHSQSGAVYTGLEILNPACCAPFLAVANFRSGLVTQASTSFGPFSKDILVGNFGDRAINAFDLATGNFVGQLTDGDGLVIVEDGLHALAFRADGFGDANALYFTAGINNGQDGLFGAITTGLVSATRASAPITPTDSSARITAIVTAAPGNSGNPPGTVTFLDGSSALGTAPLLNGSAAIDAVLSGVGTHNIIAHYNGDPIFLASTDNIGVQVTALPTILTLTAPANAAPGSTILLTATANSNGGTPTGQVVFHDGNTDLGTATLDVAGVAILRIDALAGGSHSLTASYLGDEKFAGSASAAVTVNIASPDFSLAASRATAMVMAGESTQFMLTTTPSGGFSSNVSFSCSPVTGITCAFNPATVTPTNGAASTTLTVTTSATVPRYGLSLVNLMGPCALLAALALFGFVFWHGPNLRSIRPALISAMTVLAIAGISLTVGGCGGYGSRGGNTQPNRGTATIMVTAQSGTLSHSTTLSVTVQ